MTGKKFVINYDDIKENLSDLIERAITNIDTY